MEYLHSQGIPFGREDSVKLLRGSVLGERLLVGVELAHVERQTLCALAAEMGMPKAGWDILMPHLALANAVFFGMEPHLQGYVGKIYLEFWDAVSEQVRRTRASTPLLLHLGVKWDSARPTQIEQARYTCYPLLTSDGILHRMGKVYAPMPAPHCGALAQQLVRQALRQRPDVPLIYLEATEHNNPRRSFDVNLYKTGARLSALAEPLEAVLLHFGIAAQDWEPFWHRAQCCALGHLSGGIDRRGNEFISLYVESSTA